jgi:CIC family chloride channel protein
MISHVSGLAARLLRVRRRWLPMLQGETLMLTLAAAVGLATGVLAAVLIWLVETVQRVAFGGATVTWPTLLLVPTVGALLVGLLVTYIAPECRGGGVVQVMHTIALRGGRFRARTPVAGVAATGVALGTGASGGREGPIVLIGGSVGSLVGRLFAVGEERMRTLVAAGAAAGIGASFNAPIGGMLFAIEVIIGGFRSTSLQAVVVSSVVGSVTARELIGPDIIYQPAVTYVFGDVRELGLYAVLGAVAAVVGIALALGQHWAGQLFTRFVPWPPLQLAAGGLGVGLVALVVPEVLGTGDRLPPIDGLRNPIQAMLDAEVGDDLRAIGFLLVLVVAKVIATSCSTGTGNAVGLFAPAIMCGAATGGAIGYAADLLLPGADVQPGAFALVGMAAVFAAAARAPLTAIVLAFELTGDYELVLPLMLAAGLATFIADRLFRESIYSLPLAQEGIVYAEPEDVDIMQTVRVGEVMTGQPDTLSADLSIGQAREEFRRTRHHGFPVLQDGRLVGVCTLTDMARAAGDRPGAVPRADEQTMTVGDICTRQPLTVTPLDPVYRALRRMATIDVGRLPVVSEDDHRELVGLIRRSDLVKAYRQAVTRSLATQQRKELQRLRDLSGAEYVEIRVAEEAPAAGREVRTIDWPRHTLLTSINREGELIMPNGDTQLRVGDHVTVITDRKFVATVQRLLTGEP